VTFYADVHVSSLTPRGNPNSHNIFLMTNRVRHLAEIALHWILVFVRCSQVTAVGGLGMMTISGG
jgi:hypothetical protein